MQMPELRSWKQGNWRVPVAENFEVRRKIFAAVGSGGVEWCTLKAVKPLHCRPKFLTGAFRAPLGTQIELWFPGVFSAYPWWFSARFSGVSF